MKIEFGIKFGMWNVELMFDLALPNRIHSRISDYYSFFNLLSQSSAFGGAEPDDYYTQSWVLHLPEYVKPTYPRGGEKREYAVLL